MAMGNVGHRACGCGYLRGLRRADLQSGEEETRQKDVGGHWSGSVCRCDSGGHSDRPDTDANLIGQTVCVCPAKYGISRKDQNRRGHLSCGSGLFCFGGILSYWSGSGREIPAFWPELDAQKAAWARPARR